MWSKELCADWLLGTKVGALLGPKVEHAVRTMLQIRRASHDILLVRVLRASHCLKPSASDLQVPVQWHWLQAVSGGYEARHAALPGRGEV